MKLDYTLAPPPRASIGLIVLTTDETLENEARAVTPPEVSLHHARIPAAPVVTPETLAEMEANLPAAAASFPAHVEYDAIGYACTSGATVIGPGRVSAAVKAVHPGAEVTDPISAVMAALRRLGARRIGFLTPYQADVSAAMRALLEREGFEIARFAAFEEPEEAKVARIEEASTLDGIREVGRGVDAVFASCTNLRSFGVIETGEDAIGAPVISSNSALLWRLGALGGCKIPVPGVLGR